MKDSTRNTVHVLDCTLRDGGYVNDWRFGDECAQRIVALDAESGVEYSELAFIRNCDYTPGKIEFSEMAQIARLFLPSAVKLAAMVEIGYGYPVEAFPERSAETVDLVRIVVWKRMIPEAFAYAKRLLEKGYEVSIQATRIEQYTPEEFREFVTYFSRLPLKAIYIVDTFGLLDAKRLMEYARAADSSLGDGIRLGYHAHNNMQQAVANMAAFCTAEWKHEIMIDASVMGIGRGAGNLCLELAEQYLNDNFGGTYRPEFLYECAERCIRPIFARSPWGYSIPYLLSARYARNPTYVAKLVNAGLSLMQIERAFGLMREREVGIRYDEAMCDALIEEVKSGS